jgi:hypothetical protein
MENDTRENSGQGNRNSQDDPHEDLYIDNEGLPTYRKDGDSDSDNSLSNYDDDKKNTEMEGYPDQEGYVDDTDFGQKPVEHDPDPDDTDVDDTDVDDNPDYEEDDEDDTDFEEDENEDDSDFEEEENEDFEEEINPDDEINPEEKKDYYLRGNGRKYSIIFDL